MNRLAAITDLVGEILDEFTDAGPESVSSHYYSAQSRERLDEYIACHEQRQAD